LTGIEPVVKEPVDRKSQSWETNSQIQNRNRVERDQKIIKQEQEAHNMRFAMYNMCSKRYSESTSNSNANIDIIESGLATTNQTQKRETPRESSYRAEKTRALETYPRRREHRKPTREDESIGNLPEKNQIPCTPKEPEELARFE
jgi:hypothetical protein